MNGEAIYGTRCWKKYGEGTSTPSDSVFSDTTAMVYTSGDIRFTTKGNDFYAIVLNWDDRGTVIRSLDKHAVADAKLLHVGMLGSDEKIAWTQTDEGLQLSFPKAKPCEYAYAFKLTFDKQVGAHLPSEAVDEVVKREENTE